MTRVVHVSDLHFGRVDTAVIEPLRQAIAEAAPAVVAVSGDLTQRARAEQFQAAREFMDALPAPAISVPGNHDVPLDNLFLRLLAPWYRYRRHISRDLEPVWDAGDVVVLGINSVNPFAWASGRISKRRRKRMKRSCPDVDERPILAMVHHPLELPPGDSTGRTRGAAKAIRALGDLGADVILSGHLHQSHVGALRAAPGLLFVQAGTSLSDRVREEVNAFNILDVEPGHIAVTRMEFQDGRFRARPPQRFRKTPEGWDQST